MCSTLTCNSSINVIRHCIVELTTYPQKPQSVNIRMLTEKVDNKITGKKVLKCLYLYNIICQV